MAKYLILGGRQKGNINAYKTPEWKGYQMGVALEVDTEIKKATLAFEYISPIENIADDPDASILFKAGSRKNNELVVCTQTEIIIYTLPGYQIKHVISLPCFNDLHHVSFSGDGNLLVVSTGLDAVFKLTREGKILKEWPVSDFSLWNKFDKTIDYRKVLTTKPHSHHPNYCFEYKGNVWVTRHIDKDAMNLNTGEYIKIVTGGGPHDGELDGSDVYFTTVNGKIVRADMNTLKTKDVFNIDVLDNSGYNLGWCRSLCLAGQDKYIVGFSRLRPSKYDSYTRWIKKKISKDIYAGNLPTRIVGFNAAQNIIDYEINLEEYGLNCIFSIIELPHIL
jgi:hypothetical protein